MTIRSSLAAIIAVFSVALFFAPTTNAQEKTDTNKDEKPPVVVTINEGDTLSSVADAHSTTYVRIFDANESIANPDIVNAGDQVRIPTADEQLPDRFGTLAAQQAAEAAAYVASAYQQQPVAAAAAPVATQNTTQTYTSAPVNSSSYYVGNGMWCTDYVHSKRPDVAIYGNAGYNWISSAQAAGKSTGNTPKAGAVAVTNGHVAYVEGVNADGSYNVSEMGWDYKPGNYNQRTVQPGTFGSFIY